jgi:hypothetical protein
LLFTFGIKSESYLLLDFKSEGKGITWNTSATTIFPLGPKLTIMDFFP